MTAKSVRSVGDVCFSTFLSVDCAFLSTGLTRGSDDGEGVGVLFWLF